MSFGITTFDAVGGINFSGQYKSLRVVHTQIVSPSFVGFIQVAGIKPYDTVAYCLSMNADFNARDLFTEVFDGSVRLSRYNNSYPPLHNLLLIVLRYR